MNYRELLNSAISDSKPEVAINLAIEAFSDPRSDEDLLGWVACIIFETKISPSLALLQEFVDRYPNSLHLPRIFLADQLIHSSQFDQASEYARIYLRNVKDAGLLNKPLTSAIVRTGVSKAFLQMSSAYTELGARSYSKRLIEYGLQLDLSDYWKNALNNELGALKTDMEQQNHVDSDKKWEQFFTNGSGAVELSKSCMERGFPLLANRVDLLEGDFRFKMDFKVDSNEFFKIIAGDTKLGFLLT